MSRGALVIPFLAVLVGASVATADSTDVRRSDLEYAASLTRPIEELAERWEFVRAFRMATRQLELRVPHLGYLHPEVAATHHTIGQILHESGDRVAAEEQLRYVVQLRRRILRSDHPDLVESLILMARTLRNINHRSEGFARLDEVERILETEPRGSPLQFATLWHCRGNLMRGVDIEKAEALYRRALEVRIRELGRTHRDVAVTMVWLAHVLHGRAPVEAVEGLLGEARDILIATGHEADSIMRVLDTFMAGIRASDRNLDRVLALRRLELDRFSSRQSAQPITFGRTRHSPRTYQVAGLLLRAGEEAEAWVELERNMGWMSEPFASLSPHSVFDPGRLARRDGLQAEALGLLRAGHANKSTGVSPDSIRCEYVCAVAELQELESWMHEDAAAHPDDDHLTRVQRHMHPDEAIVGWLALSIGGREAGSEGAHDWWAHVVRPQGDVQWVRLGEWDQLDEHHAFSRPMRSAGATIRRASSWPLRARADPVLSDLARESWMRLVEPLLPHLEGVERLVVTGWTPSSLPIEWLMDPEGRAIVDRFAVSYVASAGLLARLREAKARRGRRLENALVLGDPRFSPEPAHRDLAETDPREYIGDVRVPSVEVAILRRALEGEGDALDELAELPFSRHETNRVAAAFPHSEVLLGEAASESRIDALRKTGELERFDVIHMATHAIVNRLTPARSLLVLSQRDRSTAQEARASPRDYRDGTITAREILLGWKLDAELVTLSGCATGGGGTGWLLGFRQALQKAGALSTVLSLWEVDDVATALLMERFYANLTGESGRGHPLPAEDSPMSKTHALAEAKRWLRDFEDDSGRRPFEHPAYWAGFLLFGDSD